MKTFHVIPVPGGMRWEDAFEEIETFGQLLEGEVSEDGVGGAWYVIETDDGED